MTFSDRDKFIVACTIFITSNIAKKIPRKVRQSLLDWIRQKECPSVTNEEWHEIFLGIEEHRKRVVTAMMKGAMDSMNPMKAAEKIMGDAINAKLDREIREQMKDINLDELTDTEDLSPEIKDILNKVKKMKGEVDDERKEDWR